MRNWPFSPGHTLSHKTSNILRTAADMTKIKTNICRKHVEVSVIAISNVMVDKGHLCNNFPNPLPQVFFIIFTVCGIWFCSWYSKYLRYTSHFFSVQSLVLLITYKHHFRNTVLSYLPMYRPLKICVKQFWQKTHQSCLYWLVKKWYSCILGTQPQDFHDPHTSSWQKNRVSLCPSRWD